MKPPDFQSLILRLNILATGFVFFALAPTIQIFSSKFPEKKDTLWLFPVSVIAGSSLLWFLMSLALPWMIRVGIFEDRRKNPRPAGTGTMERLIKIGFPIFVLAVHMVVLMVCLGTIIVFMRSDFWEKLLVNLP